MSLLPHSKPELLQLRSIFRVLVLNKLDAFKFQFYVIRKPLSHGMRILLKKQS